MAGLTNQPLVQDSNPGAPLVRNMKFTTHNQLLPTLNLRKKSGKKRSNVLSPYDFSDRQL